MAEDRKKKRIAHIGNMGSVQATSKVHNGDELAQADCNLVYDIMESMNKSQIMSYQQLQEFRSKENCISRTNNSEHNSSKQSGKPLISKQIKRCVPEKTFPLMAKCQRSMKYLKKNRCIPKPRAHVGFIPRPSQRSISNFKLSDTYHCISESTRSHNESSKKIKQNSKKSSSSEMNGKLKKPKVSQSLGNSCDKNTFQIESSGKDPKLISNVESDSDNEFEQFLQEHHPAKCASSSNDDSSDSSAVPKKIRKRNKIKRKERKQIMCLAKVSKSKMTRRALTESEESVESEENNHNNIIMDEDSCNRQFPSMRFQRIIEYEDSDDNVSDTHVNDSGTLNYDSFNSSEDENILTKSSNNENVKQIIDMDDSEMFDILPVEPSSVASSSTSLSELKDTRSFDILKLKCKIPCYVLIERDPLLDQKVASLHTDKSSVTNMAPVSNLCDDEDCIIISETLANFMSDNSENVRQTIENRNSFQGEFTGISKSPPVSEVLTDINDVQNKYMHNEKLIFHSNGLGPQAETNSLLSNEKSSEIVCCDKDMSLEVQKDEVDENETERSVTTSSKFLSDTGIGDERGESFTVSKTTRHSPKNVNSPENELKNTLNNEKSASATENELFNVQILSVKSLNESDVIVLSDDNEEKDMETEPILNETNETAADDSDVEIICFDTIVKEEKSVNENVRADSDSEAHNKVNSGVNENSSNSSVQPIVLNDEDCIILDDAEISSENTCTSKYVDKVQQSSQINVKAVGIINNERMNSNNSEETMTISDNVTNLDKNSILKILDSIDFNCIKKVLKETTNTDTRIVETSDSVSAKAENSLCESIRTSNRTADSFPEKLKQSQSDACDFQQQASIDSSITSVGSSEINKMSSLKTSRVDTCEEPLKLIKNPIDVHNIKNVSENVPNSVKSGNVPTSSNCDISPIFCNSSANLSVPKLSVSEEGSIADSDKTELNILLHSGKNQELLPRYTKIENDESTSDVLDILASKSIHNLDEAQKETIRPLVELYHAEYKKFIEIKSTEKNVTAGLKLLEENQARKLMHISSSIKHMATNDLCFYKVKNEHKSVMKSCPVKTDESLNVTQPSNSNWPDIKIDDKVRIFHPSIVEGASEILKSRSVGPSSSQEVYNHLINSVCAECGKHATAACSGCAKVLYCSEKCGMSYWNKGHYATCRR